MKKVVLTLLFVSLIFASELPLSTEKIELLKLQREQIQKELDKDKNSWISPVVLSGSINENSDTSNNKSQIKNTSINWNQDIFRSGGIFYTRDKAKALNQFNLLGVDLKEAAYLKNIYTLKAKTKRDKLLQKQSELNFINREIDFFIISQKYKIGSTDISELNRANIDKDNAKTQIISVKNTLTNEEFELKKLIGDKRIESIILLDFELVPKEIYIKHNLELLQYNAKNKNEMYSSKITNSSFYPKLTFNSSYGYTDYSNDNSLTSEDGESYHYGLTFSMPLDINKNVTIQSAQLQYLQSKISTYDRKFELMQEYDKHFQTIKDLSEKVLIAQDTSEMYRDLYDFTSGQVSAGVKSTYDLESLANSVKIQKLEVEIQKYNILIEKISLYFDVMH